MFLLKQSTTITVNMGPALDKTDGVTEETALSPTVNLSKNGGTFAARSSATAITHDANGYYKVELDATDTGTLGRLRAYFHAAATHLPVWEDFLVVPANVHDALVGGTDTLNADVTQWLGTAVATPTTAGVPEVDVTYLGGVAQSLLDLKDFADAGYDPATNKVQGVVLVDTTTTNTDMRGTDSALLAASAPTNFGDLAITATTGEVQVGGLNAGVITATSIAAGALNGKGDWGDATASAQTTITTHLTDIKGTGFVKDTHSLPQCLTASGFSTHAAADVWSVTTRALTDKAGFTISGTKTTLDALNDVAATDIVSGGAITTSGGAVSTVSTLTGHTAQTGDSYARLGAPAGASVSADIAAVKSDTGSILTDTAEIGTAGAGLTDLGGMSTTMKAQVNAEVDSALDTAIPGTPTAGSINDVLADVDSKMPTTSFAEPGDAMDATKIAGSSTAATHLKDHVATAVPVTFSAVSATTTTATLVNVDGSTASTQTDQYVGRVLVFTGGTPNLKDVATDITAYNGATKVATFTAIPVAVDATTTAQME